MAERSKDIKELRWKYSVFDVHFCPRLIDEAGDVRLLCYKYIRFGQKCTPSNFESLNNLKNEQFL